VTVSGKRTDGRSGHPWLPLLVLFKSGTGSSSGEEDPLQKKGTSADSKHKRDPKEDDAPQNKSDYFCTKAGEGN